MGNQSSRISDLLVQALDDLSQEDVKRFKDKLSHSAFEGKRTIPRGRLENADRIDTKNLLMEFYGGAAAVEVTINVLTQINHRDSAAKLRGESEKEIPLSQKSSELSAKAYRKKYKEDIKKKYKLIKDMNSRFGDKMLLNRRYTNLTIVDRPRQAKEREHEIMATGWRHAEVMTERASSAVTLATLYKPDEDGQTPQVVVLLGAAGIGKTMTARKIMYDWAAGELYKEKFDYVFYINCREVNFLNKQGSVADLMFKNWLHTNPPINHILMNPEKFLFIIDGLDELRFSFDQPEDDLCFDPWEKKSMEIILSSLFRKTVLPESYLMITTRPAALEKLEQCLECSRYAEILGFSEAEREEYFHKFFEMETQARQALQFVKANEILFTMCFVPFMCWIICTVVKQQLEKGENLTQTSKTVTGVYVLYLSSLVKPLSNDLKQNLHGNLRGLCSLAADGIWNQKILFEEEEIKKFGLDQENSLPLFLNENIFQKETDCECLYSFIHLSFQEFFAALLYVLEEDEAAIDSGTLGRNVKALLENYGNSKNYLMLTVRFLFGLLNEERMKDMQEKFRCKFSPAIKADLLEWVQANQETDLKTLPFAHEGIHQRHQLELFHCVYEMYEEDFAITALDHFTELKLNQNKFTQMDQMALSFCVKHCRSLESLCIYDCTFSLEDHEVGLPRLQKWLHQKHHEDKPKHSPIYLLCQALKDPYCKLKKLELCDCRLTAACGEDLASLVTKQTLVELNLAGNSLGDSGVKLLCEGLKRANCKLQKLDLKACKLSAAGCGELSSVLSTSQWLSHLNLSGNQLGALGIQLLCEGLKQPNCKLQRLVLRFCNLSGECFGDLSTVLSTSQHLTELDLSYNFSLGDVGVQLLCEGLKHANCHLQRLELEWCSLSAAACGFLSSGLSQALTELNLWGTKLRDAGMQLLCEGLAQPSCKVQQLLLGSCRLTAACCGDLASILRTSQFLTELELSDNKLGDSGVQLLCEGLKHPHCKLQKLGLGYCDLTAASCGDLSSILSTSQALMELVIKWNNLGDSGVQLLCDGLKYPTCRLQTLQLIGCRFTAACCGNLASVLSTNQTLTELILGEKTMDNSGVKQVCEGLTHPNCKLQKLGLSSVNVNEETQRELEAVKKRKPDMVIYVWKNW
nr:NACHT, LRR and PYD domains-containing protein 3-like isoform X1 [Pelodiscus sinensis]XP_006131723.1 NACHT, LRR and PYD domains-containing protein 3-like isoform X1 [Pelodiscus sinensis]XP_006131725.1 NACHT, LRR and PYD domains-containing protein 3-like isoform X1 [Pelodiscus sinensis]XP_025044716.1 NACHT, LRR and PYD domains-containing protein 3-like isoform X1 [Pelodiscus sinensis]|eukprot:XP_006131722.1 NACHT, LRR and PYD domains-containing protein 3-like isoform X1 [Pelodiscus sinensis]